MKRPNLLRNITNQTENKKIKIEKQGDAGEDMADLVPLPDTPGLLMYEEYVESTISYLKCLELQLLPDPNYIATQDELKWSMRAILIDWLIEIHWKLELAQETLFFTVNLIDRFLSLRMVSSSKLQLVGITALFIAAKYEEVECPPIETFSQITSLAEEDIRKAEKYVLHVLQCFVEFPSPMTFLKICNKADKSNARISHTAQYILERMFLEEAFLRYPGSKKACCAVYLAKKVWNKRAQIEFVPSLVGYELADLRECLILANEMLSIPNIHRNVVAKYSNAAHGNVLPRVDAFFEGEK